MLNPGLPMDKARCVPRDHCKGRDTGQSAGRGAADGAGKGTGPGQLPKDPAWCDRDTHCKIAGRPTHFDHSATFRSY